MRKNFRRLTTLALMLVLVCTLAAAAFAESYSWNYETAGGTYVEMTGTVLDSAVSNTVSVDYIYGGSPIVARITFYAYFKPAGTVPETVTISEWGDGVRSVTAHANSSTDGIIRVEHAIFKCEVSLPYGDNASHTSLKVYP